MSRELWPITPTSRSPRTVQIVTVAETLAINRRDTSAHDLYVRTNASVSFVATVAATRARTRNTNAHGIVTSRLQPLEFPHAIIDLLAVLLLWQWRLRRRMLLVFTTGSERRSARVLLGSYSKGQTCSTTSKWLLNLYDSRLPISWVFLIRADWIAGTKKKRCPTAAG